jgi:hypothetical protein
MLVVLEHCTACKHILPLQNLKLHLRKFEAILAQLTTVHTFCSFLTLAAYLSGIHFNISLPSSPIGLSL